MSSPVFHSLAGAGLAYALAGDGRLPLAPSLKKAAPLMLAGAVLACLPDVDYLPGLARGVMNTVHQGWTHSLLWSLLVAGGIWMLGRAWKPEWFGWRAAVFLLVLLGSHLLVDAVALDRLAPYGFPLWAPFSMRPVHSPVSLLPAWKKLAAADLLSGANLIPLAVEFFAGAGVWTACVAGKRGWTRRPAAL